MLPEHYGCACCSDLDRHRISHQRSIYHHGEPDVTDHSNRCELSHRDEDHSDPPERAD